VAKTTSEWKETAMLQKLNERVQGIVAWAIIILIAITFMLFGVEHYFQSRATAKAKVEIDGVNVTQQQVDLEYRRLKNQQDPASLTNLKEKQLKAQALEQIILGEVTTQSAKKSGFFVSDIMAKQAILQIPQFQEDGQFSPAKYQQTLNSAMYTPESFMQQVERGMLINQQHFAYVASAFVLKDEVSQFIKLNNQTRNVDYLLVKAKSSKDIKVTPEEVNAYYTQNKSSYETPEKVSLQYVKLSMQEVTKQVDVSESEVKAYYDENQAMFKTPAEWRVAHILLSTKGKDKKKVLKQAKEVEQQLQKDPAKFAELVKKYSDDKLSAMKNGELPWIVAGTSDMDKELVKLKKPGQISAVFDTPYGFEIVKLIEVKPSKLKPFDEVKANIKKQMISDEVQRQFNKDSDVLTDMSYQTPDSLKSVSKELNLPIEQTSLFTRKGGDTELTKNKAVIAAAFSQDVLEHGNNSEPIQINNDAVVVIRVLKHEAAKPIPLAIVEPEIKELLLKQKIALATKQQGQELLDLAKSGSLTQAVLKKNNLEWKPQTDIKRESASVSLIANLAFKLPHPSSANQNPIMGESLPNGDYLIERLTSIKPGSIAKVNKEQRAAIKQQLENNYGLMDYEFLISGLMKKAEIVKHD
jgi:peptidyl-prolyl cis-trans isomerase D